MDFSNTVLTDHARQQLLARQLSEEHVRQTLSEPELILPVRDGRVVVQKVLDLPLPHKPGRYLIRVFVDIDRQPFEVVTIYRTAKIDKYRRRP